MGAHVIYKISTNHNFPHAASKHSTLKVAFPQNLLESMLKAGIITTAGPVHQSSTLF